MKHAVLAVSFLTILWIFYRVAGRKTFKQFVSELGPFAWIVAVVILLMFVAAVTPAINFL